MPAPSSPQWQPYLDELAGDVPVDFLLRWIARESAGNPCAVGSLGQLQRDGYAREAGIGQLYFETSDQRVFGSTSSELRAYCTPGTQSVSRDLTDEECRAQVVGLVAMATSYGQRARSALAAIGAEWQDEDVWTLAKLYHGLPALPRSFLPAGAAAGMTSDWTTWRAWLLSLDSDAVSAIDRGAAPYMPFGRIIQNAEYTGGKS